MKNISKVKKQQIVIVLLAAGLVIAGLWFFVVKSQQTKLAAVRKKTLEMKQTVEKAEDLLKKSDEIENTLEIDTKALEMIEDGMASGDIYLWLINTINKFNVARKITFLDFQREILGEVGILPKFPYKAATFPVKGVGHYHELGKFLAEFENSFPYVRVQNLELTPATAKAGSDEIENLNFKFEIVSLIKPTN